MGDSYFCGITKETSPFILTYSGNKFYYYEEFLEQYPYDIKEIAHVLSNICRYNGHSLYFYSVALHSALCANICKHTGNFKAALALLLHDASEVYITDIPGPLKGIFGNVFQAVENIQSHIYKRYGIDESDSKIIDVVKEIDMKMCYTEMRQQNPRLLPDSDVYADKEIFDVTIMPLTPKESEMYFLETYESLIKGS